MVKFLKQYNILGALSLFTLMFIGVFCGAVRADEDLNQNIHIHMKDKVFDFSLASFPTKSQVWKIDTGKISTLVYNPDPSEIFPETSRWTREVTDIQSHINPQKILNWLSDQRKLVLVQPEAAIFELNIEKTRVIKFSPGKSGELIDNRKASLQIIDAVNRGISDVELSLFEIPVTGSLEDKNTLGIKEIVTVGESDFKGSPKNRKQNIKVGIETQRGILIAPGVEYSFNKYLGDVTAAQGYVPELVIKADGTKPELGGGLCQVSSTVFRGAMSAGLNITQRKNHAYAVGYYAPQGTDATIYPGSQDLKFINDTGHYLMLWPEIDGTKLKFYFYGTKDGREVTVDKPVQYDRQSSGAMKAYWERVVKLPGKEERRDKFTSIYKSPALFHKETTFPTPVSSPSNNPSGTQQNQNSIPTNPLLNPPSVHTN